jgi:secreted Zn-dependent insulinase-like peptidase
MFAQCFISPLLRMDAADREINAIESEFKLAVMSDSNRISQLLCDYAVDGHVVRKFGWGNLRSLSTVPKANGVEIQPILQAFHATHYQPSAMKLVVLSPQTLDELEVAVASAFGSWSQSGGAASPDDSWMDSSEAGAKGGKAGKGNGKEGGKKQAANKKSAPASSPQPSAPSTLPSQEHSLARLRGLPPLRPEAATAITRVQSLMRTHKLHLTWQLPSQQHDYRRKVCGYISHLVGHESTGSLLKHLKGCGYATALVAGVSEDNCCSNSMFSLLRLTVTLTAAGLANWPFVCL